MDLFCTITRPAAGRMGGAQKARCLIGRPLSIQLFETTISTLDLAFDFRNRKLGGEVFGGYSAGPYHRFADFMPNHLSRFLASDLSAHSSILDSQVCLGRSE